ncbi:MAG: hypothetical protein OEY34_01180, partial [Cyclobacteriaceae bacterium]|nr:hypothetical protein [Cyclobacteriaceae bacterium]
AFMPPKTLSFNDIYIPENGYIFIYTSYTSDGISASKGFFFTSASPWGVNLSVEADFLIFGELVIPIIVEYTELNELLRLMQDIQNIAPQLLEQINRIEFGGSYGNSNSSDLPATANYSIDPIYLFDFKLLNK